MDETFSSIDLVTQCLLDKERTEKFEEAIKKVVTPKSVVLDVGTGSGILALFAARAGAKKVYSIELDPYVAKLAEQNVINNGYQNVIEVILGDARDINLPKGTTVDVVIMEMLTTGMIDEFQVWAVNKLYEREYISEKTIFLPTKQDTSVCLTDTDYFDYGLEMKMVKHFWSTLPKPKMEKITESIILNSISFKTKNNMKHESTHTIEVKKSGTINSLYLESTTWLYDDLHVGETLALNGPVSFPIDDELVVKKGEKVELSVSYDFGGGFRNFKVQARKV